MLVSQGPSPQSSFGIKAGGGEKREQPMSILEKKVSLFHGELRLPDQFQISVLQSERSLL